MSTASDKDRDSSMAGQDEWQHVTDPAERRKIQNRIAQRKFREKTKASREDQARIAENQDAAGAAYTAPDSRDLGPEQTPSGLPWGGLSMKAVVEASKAKESLSKHGSPSPSVGSSRDPQGG